MVMMRLAATTAMLLSSGSATPTAQRKYVGLTTNCQNAVSISGNEGAMTLKACEAKCDAHAPSCEAVDYGTTACYLKSACGGTVGSCNGPSCAYRVLGAPAPPAPPPSGPPGVVTIAADEITSQLSKNILGCHSDEGFMHQPQFFLSQMVYGEAFESTNGMKSGWTSVTDGTASGGAALDPEVAFAAAQLPAMRLSFESGIGSVRLAHRGMGNEGLVFQKDKPYEGYVFARSETTARLTVSLRDYQTKTVLASTRVTIHGGGGWTQLNYTLTPTAGTRCVGADQEDPDVACDDPFPDYICIKCGGELSYSLDAPGTVWFGYARLEPGTWGRFEGLPIRIEAANTLKAMGVPALRYGGSVGSSVSWKDFRGPLWNRTGLGRNWASSDMSGWGPFDAMDAFAALNISVTVTMSDSNTPECKRH